MLNSQYVARKIHRVSIYRKNPSNQEACYGPLRNSRRCVIQDKSGGGDGREKEHLTIMMVEQ